MIDYKIITYFALGTLAAAYLISRIVSQLAVGKLIRAEYEHVLNSEEHKVKGRYQ
jgi:hypothetical protein